MDLHTLPPTLVTLAESAESIASGLHEFLPHHTSASAHITSVIAQLFSLSSGLQTVTQSIRSLLPSPSHRPSPQALDDYDEHEDSIADLCYSLDYTFKDFQRLIGDGLLEGREEGWGRGETFRATWRSVCSFFEGESGNNLGRRLKIYQDVLGGILDGLRNGAPHDEELFDELAEKVHGLYLAQRHRFSPGGSQPDPFLIPPGASGTDRRRSASISRPPSFERRRPSQSQTSPEAPRHRRPSHPNPPPFSSPRRLQPDRHRSSPLHSPRSPMERGWNPWVGRGPPPAPEVPLSPTSSRTYSSDSGSGSSWSDLGAGSHGGPGSVEEGGGTSATRQHWIKKVFDRPPPATELAITGRSQCFATHKPNTLERLEDGGFTKLQELKFENGEVVVAFFQHRPSTHTKMLCEWRDSRTRQWKASALPLADLTIHRSGPYLKFSDEGEYWAALRFQTFEQLVIFHNIFLALRSHDMEVPIHEIPDYKLRSEEKVLGFDAVILDDHFHHLLKLLKDESGCIRLQATVLSADNKSDIPMKTPVWTAFITHTHHSPSWLERISPKVIHVADLYRYVFSDDYTPQTSPGGKAELVFNNSKDADRFVDVIDYLVNPPKPKKKDKKDKRPLW